ncbi:hypothetical protein K469DRAFT_744881 [Zopfia rhizophila CBS 207.26]|uniref:F-box domain-containing protein n=1 Tax=Zopfia rhizophila CBS 207.26 TaxID=1314779 RepID=A0A6A6ETU7_9PEZI|nr:hypothetical protein K469DRAFT_744881 [Zopfia rhizophila CBS 207.26]
MPTSKEQEVKIPELRSALSTLLLVEKPDKVLIPEPQWALPTPAPIPKPENDLIPELQKAFPSILIAENPKPLRSQGKIAPAKWTAAFTLFDLPRELRDRIYFYTLYRLNGVTRLNRRARIHSVHGLIDISLLLVFRHVHAEAAEAFYRCNSICLGYEYRRKPLEGSLRLFPSPYAGMVQHVKYVHISGYRQAISPAAARVYVGVVLVPATI